MPLYEYHCQRCGKTFEIIQKFSDQALSRHEGCGGELEKLVSASALHFKGSGFYINDYPRGGKPSSGDGANGKPSKTETKPETKSEAKAEAKPAARPAKTGSEK
jgi:putative FmdB family regulatory protein